MQRARSSRNLFIGTQVHSRRDVPTYNPQKYEPKRELRGWRHIELAHRDRACTCTHQTRYPGAAGNPSPPFPLLSPPLVTKPDHLLPETRALSARKAIATRIHLYPRQARTYAREICIERFVRNAHSFRKSTDRISNM